MKSRIAAKQQYLEASDICDIIGVMPKQIISWAKDGKIPHLKLPNGRFRFKLDDVIKSLKS